MNTQGIRRLGETRLIEDGPKRGKPLPADVRASPEERREQRVGLAPPVGQVVQTAQQSIRGEAIGPGDRRRVGEGLGRFEGRPRVGLGG